MVAMHISEKYTVDISNRRGSACSRLKCSPCMRKFGYWNPSRERPKSLKQVVAAPLPNARQQV